MHYILKNTDEETKEKKPYYIRFMTELYEPLGRLSQGFEQGTDKPILIETSQKDRFMTPGRTFWVTSWLDISVIRWVLEHLSDGCDGLRYYAFCTHDRDYTKDGEPKKVHTHILLYFDERVSASFVCAWFHTTEVAIVSQYDISGKWNYLIHDSEKCRKERKFQYQPSERFTNDINYWTSRCVQKSSNEYYVDLFMDIHRGKMKIPDVIRKYGYEVIRSVRCLRILSDMYYAQLNNTFEKSAEEMPEYKDEY